MLVVDAHEDIAWNMLTFGRDYTQAAALTRTLEADSEAAAYNGHTLLGWPDWLRGRVALVFATLFVSPAHQRMGEWDRLCYHTPDEAHELMHHQLELYHRLTREHPDKFILVKSRADLDALLAGWQGEPHERRVGFVLLMEGADGVRSPQELHLWYARGLRLLGPAWAGTRYAGGTGEPGPLSAEGYLLLDEMARLNMVLDLSHLAEEATQQALHEYQGPVIASHSNPRGLLAGSLKADRYLSDETIRHLARRDGVVGIMPYNRFLQEGWRPEQGREGVTLARVAQMIDYICQLTGSTAHVGIGSDFDGGFGLDKVPAGIESVADLHRIGEALLPHGYTQSEIRQILGGNWLRVLRAALPAGEAGS